MRFSKTKKYPYISEKTKSKVITYEEKEPELKVLSLKNRKIGKLEDYQIELKIDKKLHLLYKNWSKSKKEKKKKIEQLEFQDRIEVVTNEPNTRLCADMRCANKAIIHTR